MLVIVTNSDTILDSFDQVWLMNKDTFRLHSGSNALITEKDVVNEALVAS